MVNFARTRPPEFYSPNAAREPAVVKVVNGGMVYSERRSSAPGTAYSPVAA
jgi:hypothetical protein